ncbi:MAG TPA: ATP-binding protein [Methanoregulaceae archaeon]|nr:ATP-binding protein [Methanoregulaceae archaeon]HQJ87353.1 ATP-binding protein [Methanoregulaceae archaeon]
MKRLAVISGKGGTGKTMVTAALAHLLQGHLVIADCDVDAANLALLLNPRPLWTKPFFGMQAAAIDPDLCLGCGACETNCRFEAIRPDGGIFRVDTLHCEGCAVCRLVCPAEAVNMQPRQTGMICYSETDRGHLVHARLVPGAGNSGLLVSAVKKTALENDPKSDLLLIDGPPGTGCPLISTISGVDLVLVVTEPSISGLHDLERVVAVCRQFRPGVLVAINRFDLSPTIARMIHLWCRDQQIPLIGEIPFDPKVIETVRQGVPITRAVDSPALGAVQEMAVRLEEHLDSCASVTG